MLAKERMYELTKQLIYWSDGSCCICKGTLCIEEE